MSERSNYVWRENDTTTIWYAGGTSAHYIPKIAFRGLDYCRLYFGEIGSEEPFLMNNAWAEGGLMVDVDTKTVLYFGTYDWFNFHYQRTLELEEIRKRWPGWDVRIASRNVEDFGRHLGIFSEQLLADTTAPDQTETLQTIEQEVEYGSPQDFVLTVIRNQKVTDYELNHSDSFLLVGLGPGLAEMFGDRYRITDWQDEDETYSCILADYDKKEVFICHPTDYDSRHEAFAQEAWPGWKVAFHYQGLVFHFTHTGRDPAPVLQKPNKGNMDYLSLSTPLKEGYELPREILQTLPEFHLLASLVK